MVPVLLRRALYLRSGSDNETFILQAEYVISKNSVLSLTRENPLSDFDRPTESQEGFVVSLGSVG